MWHPARSTASWTNRPPMHTLRRQPSALWQQKCRRTTAISTSTFPRLAPMQLPRTRIQGSQPPATSLPPTARSTTAE
eukprot:9469174-Pyramimonas_sp.AAC.1